MGVAAHLRTESINAC